MNNKKAVNSAGLLILSCISCYVSAATSSSIKLELGTDENSDQSYYLSGSQKFENSVVIRASFGENICTDALNAEVTSEYWTAGIQTDPSALLSLGFDKSRSSQEGALEIDAVSLSVDMNATNWSVFIASEQRDISFTTIFQPRKITFESSGVGAGVTYYGWDPVYFTFTKVVYDYPAQLSAINNRIALVTYIFGAAAIDGVFALEDERSTFEAGYFFSSASIAVSTSEGQSAIDQSILTINKVYLTYNLSGNWVIGASAGESKIDIDSGTTWFGSLSLGYRW